MEKVRLEEVSKKRSSNLAQKDVEGLNGDYPIYDILEMLIFIIRKMTMSLS